MPLGFASHHPEGMADNSPTFQRWEPTVNGVRVPKGRLTVHAVSRPSGTRTCPTFASAPGDQILVALDWKVRAPTLNYGACKSQKMLFAALREAGYDVLMTKLSNKVTSGNRLASRFHA